MRGLYPSEDSRSELDGCRQEIERLGLGQHVTLDTRFLPIQQVHELIAEADIAVLPYEHSGEGGSATLATCLAVGLPVVVSGAAIFDELRSVVSTVEPATPEAIAFTVGRVLRTLDLYEELVTGLIDYAQRNSWTRVASLIRRALSEEQLIRVHARTPCDAPLP